MRSRIIAALAAVSMLTTVSVSALPGLDTDLGSASATAVKCAEGDVTPDGRVFPEPTLTETFLTFAQFECGINLLNERHPEIIEITDLRDLVDHEAAGLDEFPVPIYNIVVTDESVPVEDKRHLLIMSSIHGNEHAGREGGARVIEDIVTPALQPDLNSYPGDVLPGGEDPADGEGTGVDQLLSSYVIHFVFPNPDGWINGDLSHEDGGANFSRRNDDNRDLNRNFPVQGYLHAPNGTLTGAEGLGLDALLQSYADTEHDVDDPAYTGWYLGTDNHGQSAKPVAASGLQIVGQFDFQKSERLAHFADGIGDAMGEYGALTAIEALNEATGGAVAPYEWGTLYDILGYSASGSGIDYYNTPGVVEGTGFATEMTASNLPFSNIYTHPGLVNQMWVDSVRAINYTMFRDSIAPPSFTYEVGGSVAYIDDPDHTTSTDGNGMGDGNVDIPGSYTGDLDFRHYDVSRMRFFEDLNDYAVTADGTENDLTPVSVDDVLAGSDLSSYDTVILADDVMPLAEGETASGADRAAYVAALQDFVSGGGNLMVTDGALPLLADLFDGISVDDVAVNNRNVGFADFTDRSHPLNANLRGVASQTYDVIPIGFRDNANNAPNWTVATSAWEAVGGFTAGTNGSGRTIYGEAPLGEGQVTVLGALLPEPTEANFHPYGLQNYAVTYTGYTLLQNVLTYTR